MKTIIALAGNPNAGKTSLFNVLTGTRQQVGNWPGVTVEKKEGVIKGLDGSVLIDLPGIYSLSAQSLEEKLAISYLLLETPDTIVNIVDASNLERNLYFSLQLLEMGLPSIVVLNMMDVARSRGLHIDENKLADRLGVPVIPMVARKGSGHERLLGQLAERRATTSMLTLAYPSEVEEAIGRLLPHCSDIQLGQALNPRWLAAMWLERNESVEQLIQARVTQAVYRDMERIRDEYRLADQLIRNARYTWIENLLTDVTERKKQVASTWSDRIDSVVLHRIWGIPIFLGFMYLVFQLTFSWIGTTLSDAMDAFFNGTLTEWVQQALALMDSPEWFSKLVTDGILAGVGSVLVFVPQIAILFLCLSFLEDSGYMARAAILMDRFMLAIGLNGKAFIPLILGFGCNVPAIMATRTLEDPKGRLVTALIAPFMSCSARLSVFSLFVAAFFTNHQAEIVFILYVTGILMAVFTAFLLKRFIKAEEGLFLMELPPYRAPMVKSLLLHTWDKAKGFVRKAGTIIFGMSVLIWFLGNYSWHGAAPMNESFLAAIGGSIAPLFAPMGFATWQAGVSLITGFLAKEVVVTTMSIAYMAGDSGNSLMASLQGAFSPAAALSFLFFLLLYTPCVSTVVIMKKETGSWKWTILSVVYSFVAAWVVALLVYEVARVIY
ncbi:ferrous iron transport protein B [Brevibacillus fluminis]|uniref:Ferrous iron transport protein B n=1 Tax=Brevibacillus fluminis TaxID=511487 RepID=A0A3M8DHN0_9BACL|nr:ferrous iron transport protein B [Brevibacillus fluminis]RNB87109.1 ferrous iron transport protein B [Brevibacillus fluminis]